MLQKNIQEHIVAVIHNDAGICQIVIIGRIHEAIAIPAYAQGIFLDNPLGAFKIGHAQSRRCIVAA